jgi:hypothetical protein
MIEQRACSSFDPLISQMLAQRSRWAIEIIGQFGMTSRNCAKNGHLMYSEKRKKRREIALRLNAEIVELGPAQGPRGRPRGRWLRFDSGGRP